MDNLTRDEFFFLKSALDYYVQNNFFSSRATIKDVKAAVALHESISAKIALAYNSARDAAKLAAKE